MLPHMMLEQAWKTIDAPEKWCRFIRHDVSTGERCALGALDATMAASVISFRQYMLDYEDACKALIVVMPSKWQAYAPHHAVADYNNQCKSWDDIRDWWQAAIANARREHNQKIIDDLIQITASAEVETGSFFEKLPV